MVGNQTHGSVGFCLPASFMEGCHHYTGRGMGAWAGCPVKCGFSTTAQGKRRGKNHPETCLWEGSFQLDATRHPHTHPVLAALKRRSLVRAVEQPSTNRGGSTMKTAEGWHQQPSFYGEGTREAMDSYTHRHSIRPRVPGSLRAGF